VVKKKDLRNIIVVIKIKEPKEAIKDIITAKRLLNSDLLFLTLIKKVRIKLKKSNN
jgi:hypothetical protein